MVAIFDRPAFSEIHSRRAAQRENRARGLRRIHFVCATVLTVILSLWIAYRIVSLQSAAISGTLYQLLHIASATNRLIFIWAIASNVGWAIYLFIVIVVLVADIRVGPWKTKLIPWLLFIGPALYLSTTANEYKIAAMVMFGLLGGLTTSAELGAVALVSLAPSHPINLLLVSSVGGLPAKLEPVNPADASGLLIGVILLCAALIIHLMRRRFLIGAAALFYLALLLLSSIYQLQMAPVNSNNADGVVSIILASHMLFLAFILGGLAIQLKLSSSNVPHSVPSPLWLPVLAVVLLPAYYDLENQSDLENDKVELDEYRIQVAEQHMKAQRRSFGRRLDPLVQPNKEDPARIDSGRNKDNKGDISSQSPVAPVVGEVPRTTTEAPPVSGPARVEANGKDRPISDPPSASPAQRENKNSPDGWKTEIAVAPIEKPAPQVHRLPSLPLTAPSLLRTEDAARIQERLKALGYFGTIEVTIDGFWGPLSRAALRSFKIASGLPDDDVFDTTTAARLLSPLAKSAPAGMTVPAIDRTGSSDRPYPPPAGASNNPLNRTDAKRIQFRLAELGYYDSEGDGIWGEASLTAIQNFRLMNGLSIDGDYWDEQTERTLFGSDPVAAYQTIVGKWAMRMESCNARPPDVGDVPIEIGAEGITHGEETCEFDRLEKEGSAWVAEAECASKDESYPTVLHMSRTQEGLTLTTRKQSTKFVRCPPRQRSSR